MGCGGRGVAQVLNFPPNPSVCRLVQPPSHPCLPPPWPATTTAPSPPLGPPAPPDDYAPPTHKAAWFAAFYLCIPVGFAFGYIFGGIVTASLSWRWAFIIEGLVMVPFIVFALLAQPLHLAGSVDKKGGWALRGSYGACRGGEGERACKRCGSLGERSGWVGGGREQGQGRDWGHGGG